ncbi:MAG TPA: ABC transporter permease, partial [Rhodanobacteraceae bacterium]|nr:ABC transporter permease [Rhodanobacteraceae bacterium]
MRGFKRFLLGLGLGLLAIIGVIVLMLLPWPLLIVLVLALVAWMAFTRSGRQAWSVTWVGISTLPQRIGSSSVVVVGIAGVVGVLVALLALGDGFQSTMKETGSDDTAIILRSGALTELNSVLDRDTTALIGQGAGVLKDAEGKPIVS